MSSIVLSVLILFAFALIERFNLFNGWLILKFKLPEPLPSPSVRNLFSEFIPRIEKSYDLEKTFSSVRILITPAIASLP